MPLHYLDFISLDVTGCRLACPMERPATVLVACACGWTGAPLPLDEDGLSAWRGDVCDEVEFERVTAFWQSAHANGLVPGLVAALDHLEHQVARDDRWVPSPA